MYRVTPPQPSRDEVHSLVNVTGWPLADVLAKMEALGQPIVLFFFSSSGSPRDLHSFPTRRSSDLAVVVSEPFFASFTISAHGIRSTRRSARSASSGDGRVKFEPRSSSAFAAATTGAYACPRSEEHTSELQSLRHLVCRLLLEKKNK